MGHLSMESFKEWCDQHAFDLYESGKTHRFSSRLLALELWSKVPLDETDFEVVTILGSTILISGYTGNRRVKIINNK